MPAGKWRLDEYKFGDASQHSLKGVDTTLVIKQNGNLGGDTGCNAYGGSYALADGKLAITDIISTMRACDEPTPEFEKNYFDTLENVASVEIKDSALVIADKNGHFLRFVRRDK